GWVWTIVGIGLFAGSILAGGPLGRAPLHALFSVAALSAGVFLGLGVLLPVTGWLGAGLSGGGRGGGAGNLAAEVGADRARGDDDTARSGLQPGRGGRRGVGRSAADGRRLCRPGGVRDRVLRARRGARLVGAHAARADGTSSGDRDSTRGWRVEHAFERDPRRDLRARGQAELVEDVL